MRKISPLIIFITIILLIVVVGKTQPQAPTTKSAKPTESNPVSYPAGGDTLKKGKNYVIRWMPGNGKTDIFLINHMLESEGVSVSIADRIYNIDDYGQYNYRVPTNIPDGEYKFQIGDLTSKYFTVTK